MRKYAIFIALSCAMIITLCGSVSAAAPATNFTVNTTNGFAPLSVQFNDTSTGNPTSWNWSFGDGQTSTLQNPKHTYNAVGAYNVTLNTSNSDGSNYLAKTNYITAWNTTGVMSKNNGIDFYVSNDAGVKYDMPNGVTTAAQYGGVYPYIPNTYYIAQGGGGSNPIQISTDPTYKPGQLTTTNNQTGKFYIVFSGGIGHLDDAILLLAVNGTIPNDFAFTVTSSGYTYNLAPPAASNPATSSLTNVTYVTDALNETFYKSDFLYGPQSWKPANTVNTPIFAGQSSSNNFSLMFIDLDVGAFVTNGYTNVTNGSIEVDYSFSNLDTFAAFGAYGWFSACNWGTGIPMTNNQVVSGFNVQGITPIAPVANFTANTTTGSAPLNVQFTDTSSNTPTSWLWDFGDGTTSTSQNPDHIYSEPGTYNVTLTAINDGGNNTIVQNNFINVPYPPVAGFTTNVTNGLNPLNVQFNDQSTGTVTSYYWDFGDGTNSTLQNPTHIYTLPGTYTVTETVTGPGGNNTITLTNMITVFNSTPPNVTATQDTGIYNSSQNVTLMSDQPGSTIYYTTDGSDPQTSPTSVPYSNPIPVNSTTTLQFEAVNQGGVWSTRYTKTYTIDTSIPSVTANPNGGSYISPQTVTLNSTDADTNTTTYYTVDGTDPYTSTTRINYTGPIAINTTTTLRYIAVDMANNWSPEYTQNYIFPTPVANFTSSSTTGSFPLIVQFTDQSQSATSWLWNFGDGTTSTQENPSHTYTQTGNYNVSLTAINSQGNNTMVMNGYISVTNVITSSSNIYITMSNHNGTAFFDGGPANSYYYTVGGTNQLHITNNTATSRGQVTISNSQSGTFYITTTGGRGSNDDLILMVAVKGPISNNFSLNLVSSGYVMTPGSANANDYVTGALNETFTAADFLYGPQLLRPGSTGMTVIYNGENTSDPTAAEYLMFVDLYVGNLASASINNGAATVQYTFTNLTTQASFDTNAWALGYDAKWSNDATSSGYNVIPIPVASFTVNNTSGTAPQTINFTDTSSNNPTSWLWDFGDGNTSTIQDPTHIYNTPGTYTVTLTAGNNDGNNTITQTNYINIGYPAPIASFTTNATTGTAPLNIQFTDTSTGNINTYNWDFGDGTTSTEQNPTHTYNTPGTYTITETVTGLGGTNSQTQTNLITANYPAPIASFTTNATTGTAPLNIQFTDTSTGNINTYNWDFGDGTTSTQQNPTHTYNTPGTYTITETVTGLGGTNSQTQTNLITANYPAPIASFTTNATTGTAPLNIQFTDTSTGNINTYNWDFGDGTTSTQQNPTHTYSDPGLYTVIETVTGPGGSDVTTMNINVKYPAVTASFTTNTTTGKAPLSVQFTDRSTNNPVSWYWKFGDGTTSTEQNPTHTYNTPGTYTITETVTGHDSNSIITSIITVKSPDTTKPTAKASKNGATYNANQSISLSMNESGSIYYTTNGTTPTATSKKYTGPITITTTTNLKFVAIDLAGNKSPVYTDIYTIDKTAPKVVSTIPKNGATGVSTTSTITVKLSENLKTGVNWSKIYMKNLTTGKLVSIKTSINGNEINIKMVKTRYTNNLYEVYIPTGAVKDNAGNNLKTVYILKFKTV